MDIELNKQNMDIIKAIASETRVDIINLLRNGPKNITGIATSLNLSPSIITRHIKLLEDSNIILTKVYDDTAGKQKFCTLNIDQLTINFPFKVHNQYHQHTVDIPVGSFTNYSVKPTCGLASSDHYIGVLDEPKYFMDPGRLDAQLIWFSEGFVEYNFFNPINKNQEIQLIEISLEVASEFPENNYVWPSDIHFSLNNVNIGKWTSPGNFADVPGINNPDWWPSVNSQYGLLKTIRITPNETQIDGEHLSNYKLSNVDFNTTFFTLKLSVPETTTNVGGLTIFGEKFGNYSQNINVKFYYSDRLW